MRRLFLVVFAACAGAGDGVGTGRSPIEGIAAPTDIPSTGKVPDGCARIEGGELGTAGLVVELLGGSVTFTSWQTKAGEAGEYIGFTLSTAGVVGYAVKAGRETHYGSAGTWAHPGGTGGPNASGISNVTLCPLEPGGGGGAGGGSGTGGAGGGLDEGGNGGTGGGSVDEGGGGGSSGGLDEGQACTSGAQCLSGSCTNGVCVASIN